MEFPAIVLFEDGSMKAIESEDHVRKSRCWATASYDQADRVIDAELNSYRICPSNDEEKFLDLFTGTNIAVADNVNEDIAEICQQVKHALEYSSDASERELLNRFLGRIDPEGHFTDLSAHL